MHIKESWFEKEAVFESFDVPRAEYPLTSSDDCPGETQVVVRWSPEGHAEKGALRVDYFVKQGTFRGIALVPPQDAEAAGLSLWAKGKAGSAVFLRLKDATGQYHCRPCSMDGLGWQRVDWVFHFDADAKPSEVAFMEGANDGVVHLPLQEILIAPGEGEDAGGGFLVDDVALGYGLRSSETVAVDLADKRGPMTHCATGFLFGLSAEQPPDELLKPLKPRLYRFRSQPFIEGTGLECAGFRDRLHDLGMILHTLHSDAFSRREGYPGDGGEWTRWEESIAHVVQQAKENGWNVEWDIWNEPDYHQFWKRSQEQFLDTWRVGYRKLREVDPEANIVGPSIAAYNRAWMERFLTYAQDHDVVPDILCWHELSWHFLDYRSIEGHAAHARAFLNQLGLKVKAFDINEYVIERQAFRAGVHPWYFAGIEDAGIRGAAHATWHEADGSPSAHGPLLTGILTPDLKPRSVWWTYKAYGDITGERVAVHPGLSVHGVAGVDEADESVRMVLGRDEGTDAEVRIRVDGLGGVPCLAGRKAVRIEAQRIPNTEYEPLEALEPMLDENVAVEAGSVCFTLPAFRNRDAYAVCLRPG